MKSESGDMNGDARFSSGASQSQLMTSLMEYSSIKSDPLQALLASTHMRSRSPWQPLDDTSSPWQHSHALHHPTFDDLSNKGFQPWRRNSELPFDGSMTAFNRTVGELSPPNAGGQSGSGSDQRQQHHQQQHQSWSSSMYGGSKLWPTSYGEYDWAAYQQQPSCSTYGPVGVNGEPSTSMSASSPFGDNKQSNPVIETSSCNSSSRSPTTSAAMAAAARMQAVARYFNDRWYTATATGYGQTHSGFDTGNAIAFGESRNGTGSGDDASGFYASMAGRYSSSSLSALQQTSCSSVMGGLTACGSLLPSETVSSTCNPFSGRWMWNTPPGCGVNASYLLNSCSQLPTAADRDRKQLSISSSTGNLLPEYREDTKTDFRFPGVINSGGSMSVASYAEIGDGKERSADRKLSPEAKKKRSDSSSESVRHQQSAAASITSSSSTQRAPRQAGSSLSSTPGLSSRSSTSACECPNCKEADRIGGAAGEHIRRLGQHSCHVPGCGKVYSKTSHLKAHLHWHNAGSSVINSSTGGNSIREPSASGKSSSDQRYEVQRQQPTNFGDGKDRLVPKRSRKRSRAEIGTGSCDSSNDPGSITTGARCSVSQPQCLNDNLNRTFRATSSELIVDSSLDAGHHVTAQYQHVITNGSVTDDSKRSPGACLHHSPNSGTMYRSTEVVDIAPKCRRSPLTCDDIAIVSGRTSAAGSLGSTGACASDRPAALTVNG